jgi:hypothetical protein
MAATVMSAVTISAFNCRVAAAPYPAYGDCSPVSAAPPGNDQNITCPPVTLIDCPVQYEAFGLA